MVDPSIMCSRHLLGEHLECHMFVGTINKGTKITGYIQNKLLSISDLHSRHDTLATEMVTRGYKHNSPLPALNNIQHNYSNNIDYRASLQELLSRCLNCKANYDRQ